LLIFQGLALLASLYFYSSRAFEITSPGAVEPIAGISTIMNAYAYKEIELSK